MKKITGQSSNRIIGRNILEDYPAKKRSFDMEENREIMVALMNFIGEGGHQKMLEYNTDL